MRGRSPAGELQEDCPPRSRRQRIGPASLALVTAAILCGGLPAVADVQTFTVEGVNDSEFSHCPPPLPARAATYVFNVTSSRHEETITVTSRNLRNLSITLENTGSGLVRSPYLFGPCGWDFRSLEAVAAAVTGDLGLTNTEKFIRLHEWKGLHVAAVLGKSSSPYDNDDFAGNPGRVLNQYGHAMCGESTATLNALLRVVPPIGSMYGRKAQLNAHRTGEAFFDGRWHAYDTTPANAVVQWIYYDSDNTTIASTWKYLLSRPELITRVKGYCGFSLSSSQLISGATGNTSQEDRAFRGWDFNYDLRPGESATMHFDMRGRLDRISARQDNDNIYRCYSDYGSAVFTYRPDLKRSAHTQHLLAIDNVRQTTAGLVPADTSRKSSVVVAMHSTWCFVGANIQAAFKRSGSVYIAVNPDPYDIGYPERPAWQLLSASRAEYASASIEGKMAFWVKFEFEGSASGLDALEVAAEVQMSPWSMPGLRYGRNTIRFEAADMGGSRVRVTYRYDDQSPFHVYEPAASLHGRHIPLRIGGVLQRSAKLTKNDYGKGRFWQRLIETPGADVRVRLEIVKVSGENSGRLVRTLVNKDLPFGWYTFYWDGNDDRGLPLPRGMYCYRLSIDGGVTYGERLYLYQEIWPLPNEMRAARLALLASPDFRRGDADANGVVDMADALYLLDHLFRDGPLPPCLDAADADDDDRLGLTDVELLLKHALDGDAELPLPGPLECGSEPAGDSGPGCLEYPACSE